MLVRGGFSTGVIFRILKRWNVSEGALEGLESVEEAEGEES
jgi:hypothetical protein